MDQVTRFCPCGSGRKFRYCHGKGLPALENIVTISIDRERKQTIIITKDRFPPARAALLD
ncbi:MULTISPECIES: SEC-C metal-binding domain-containing protein [unclassified Bradyrhizobium]|uniref:SEC-C metal-binding domain-containing protein n=1 Tax=unclassified Bradyrhizobium TaxID=2631580 RepID=UPI0033936541